MKRISVTIAILLIVVSGVLLSLSPDKLSLLILLLMCLVEVMGFALGLMPMVSLATALRRGTKRIEQAVDLQADETWVAVFRVEQFFGQPLLDKLFGEYKVKVLTQKDNGDLAQDIEDYISEDVLGLRTWQGLILQIPGIMTGLGILGTFLGLVIGINAIQFSSVNAAIESVSSLLSGIHIAFYTSIGGVILSILFNILNRLIWNMMIREHGVFIDSYHREVLPAYSEQFNAGLQHDMKKIIGRLDRLTKNTGFTGFKSGEDGVAVTPANEKALMPQIMDGLRSGEFTFYLQPRYDINNQKLVAAEALVRWAHPTLGMMTPDSFLPILEKNGYITKMDAFTWNLVCSRIRTWIDMGIRPVPISVNISKTDILAMDVPKFFESMLEKYRIPPRSIELEIAKSAFVLNPETTKEVTAALRKLGFTVVMDHFDGDYISINMLEGIEIDSLKLNIRAIPGQDISEIDAIFAHARKLHIEMTAEGIENALQLAELRNAGCSFAQGYYLQKPISIELFEETCEMG